MAHAIDEAGNEGFTPELLAEREGLPFTQVAVTLAFLKERGIVETRYRHNYTATQCAHLDAMPEYFALAENAYLRRQGSEHCAPASTAPVTAGVVSSA